jgi:hypothetical protein
VDAAAEVPDAPLAAGTSFPLPDAQVLTARVLEAVRGAADHKAARALVVADLQDAKAQASADFEAA